MCPQLFGYKVIFGILSFATLGLAVYWYLMGFAKGGIPLFLVGLLTYVVSGMAFIDTRYGEFVLNSVAGPMGCQVRRMADGTLEAYER